MAKEVLGTTITIDESDGNGRNISNDIRSWQLTTNQGLIDITGLDKNAIERIGALKDAQLTLVVSWNDDSNMSFEVFKDYSVAVTSSNGRTVAIAVSGNTLTMEMVIESVQVGRDQSGDLVLNVSMSLCNGTVPTWA